jgi:fibronectin-binding autotransporter adhesin
MRRLRLAANDCPVWVRQALCGWGESGLIKQEDRRVRTATEFFYCESSLRPAPSPAVTLWITVLCLLTALFSVGSVASAQTDTWTGKGGNSNWSNTGNWNDGAIKRDENLLINLTTAATDVNQDFSIGTLTLSNVGDSATISNGVTLTVGGNITNNGTITLNSSGGTTGLVLGTEAGGQTITLSGSGKLILSNNANNFIAAGDNTLLNEETISGAGQIGATSLGYGLLTLANSGTINANASAGMIIDAAGGVTNTGTIEATGGATLELTNTGSTAEMEIINTGGTISANAGTLIVSGATINGGTVTLTGAATLQLGGSTIEGVTLTNSATGTIEAGGFNTLEGTINNPAGGTIEIDHTGLLTLAGNISNKGTINDGGYLTLASNISNAGTINLAPVGSTTSTAELLVDGDITLSGGGKVTMSNNVNNFIIANGAGFALLTNEETISGAGQIGAPALATGPLTLVNSGTINSNASAGMTIETLGGLTNTGTIEATGGATLQLLDMGPQEFTQSIVNTGGTISANASTLSLTGTTIVGGAVTLSGASTLLMNNSTIQGATLNTSTTGLIESVGGTSIINASVVNFHNTGTLEANGGDLTIEGPGTTFFTNDNQTTGTLTGGTYIANENNINWAGGPNGIKTLSATVIELNDSDLFNTTTSSNMLAGLTSITASGSLTLGADEGISDAGAFSNTGSLTLLPGVVVFSVGSLTQISGGSLTAGTYVLDVNLSLSGATQNITTNAANLTLGGGTIENANSTNALAGLASNTGSLTIAGTSNNVSTTAASFSNTGTLTIDAGDNFTTTKLTQITGTFPAETLSGGTYVLSGNLNVTSGTVNITTNSANLTLAGGTIIAQDPPMIGPTNALAGLASNTKSLTIAGAGNNVSTTAASFSNTGTLTIDGGDSFTAAKLTQISGSTLSGGTYVLGGNLDLTTAGISLTTNSSTLTLEGGIINSNGVNALSALASNTKSLTLADGASLTTSATSNFTNSGTVDVANGSTLTVGGTSHSYNQTAGTTTVDGTLSGGTTGSASVTGGTILGAGTVKGNLSVGNASGAAATINVGNSGVAGLLSITGKYTQLATGTMTGLINGTAAGSGFSQLKVTGAAALAGTINFTVATAFQASLTLGENFTVLTAGSVTGKFSNSEIAISSGLHFNVTYTATGVVLTVASGAAVVRDANNVAQPAVEITKSSAEPAAVKGKSAVLISGVRRGNGAGKISRPVVVAGLGPADRPEFNNLRIWEHIPVVHAWPVAGPQMPRVVNESPTHSYSQPTSDLGIGGGHTIGVRSPLRGWMSPSGNRRAPVKILAPMLPRMSR